MNIPSTSTPWVPLFDTNPKAPQIPPPHNGRFVQGVNGLFVWQDVNDALGLQTPDAGWQIIGAGGAIPFENGWGDWPDVNFTPSRFRKLSDGLVIFDGLLGNSGAASTTAFTMPVGYRPSLTQALTVNISHWRTGTSYAVPWGSFWAYADGRIVMETAGAGKWISLQNLKYYAGG